tara:strand:- start:1624 stop:1854 length:231 start_codon:yes stop_codon:yes gene_type:complete
MRRKYEILAKLEQAAVDGGFKLHIENDQIIATDLLNKTKPFALRFEGGEDKDNPFIDLYVNETTMNFQQVYAEKYR